MMTLSRPFMEDRLALPLSTPLYVTEAVSVSVCCLLAIRTYNPEVHAVLGDGSMPTPEHTGKSTGAVLPTARAVAFRLRGF